MAELLLTQTELDAYLSQIDLSDPTINSVFNSIQLLTINNYNDLLYYLVNGKITLRQLIGTPINNASARSMIRAAELGGDTLLSKKREYETFFKSLPGYAVLNQDLKTSLGSFMYQMSYPATDLVTTVEIDTSGLNPAKFNGVSSAKSKYIEIVNSCRQEEAYLALKQFCDQNGLAKILDLMNFELDRFELVASSDRRLLPVRVDSKTSLCGYVLRSLHLYSYRVSYNDYMSFIFTKMAERSFEDELKNGVAGVKFAWTTMPWERLANPDDAATFIHNLGLYHMVWYRIPKIYGTAFFTDDDLIGSISRLSLYVGHNSAGALDIMRLFLLRLTARLNDELVP
jgi:hypothetical protein